MSVLDTVSFKDIKTEKQDYSVLVKLDNNKEIKIKQYLPVNDKLKMITKILDLSTSNPYNFVNPVQLDVYISLEIIYNYTNIEFTEEEKENPAELYDELEKADIIDKVIAAIPKVEYEFIARGVEDTVREYYRYQNSALGILETVSKDYSDLNLEAEDIQKKIGDPNNLSLLKNVLEKLG